MESVQTPVIAIDSAEDIALADRMNAGRKRIMDEHGKTSLGELVRPAQAIVILVAMLLHERVNLIAELCDLAPAKILVPTMIVEREYCG